MDLYGRARECESLDRHLRQVRGGRSAVLVLRGEAGVDKTALLEHVSRRATGCRVVPKLNIGSRRELRSALGSAAPR